MITFPRPRHHSMSLRSLIWLGLPWLLAAPMGAGTDDGEPLTSFHREWVWMATGHRIGEAGLLLVDSGPNGSPEILYSVAQEYQVAASWSLGRYDGTLRHLWSALPFESPLRFVTSTPDGADLLVVAGSDSEVRVYDAESKSMLSSFPPPVSPLLGAVAGDFDAVPGVELALCGTDGLYVLELPGGAVREVRYGFSCTDLAAGQGDGDAALELALAGNSLGGYVLDGASLAIEWADLAGFGSHVSWADTDADGMAELLCGFDGLPDVRMVNPRTGQTLWVFPGPEYQDLSTLEAADVSGDGRSEALVYHSYGSLKALDIVSGDLLWTADAVGDLHAVTAGDVDGDGGIELVVVGESWNYASRLYVLDAANQQLEFQSSTILGPFYGLATGDREADGQAQLVIPAWVDEEPESRGPALLAFHAVSHALISMGPPLPITDPDQVQVPTGLAMAEMDGDAALEVCLALQFEYTAHGIWCEDGATREVEWQLTFPDYQRPSTLLVGEIDGGAMPELLVGTDGGAAFAFEGESGWLKWRTPELPDFVSITSLRLGNVISSLQPDLVTANNDTWDNPVTVFETATGQIAAGPFDLSVTALDLTELDGDPELEIVVGTEAGTVAELDPLTGVLSAPWTTFGDTITALRLADMDRDGQLDVIVAVDGRIHVWSPATQATLWTSPFLGAGAGANDTLWAGNLDPDAAPEIAINLGPGVALFEGPLGSVFADGFESGDTSAWSATIP